MRLRNSKPTSTGVRGVTFSTKHRRGRGVETFYQAKLKTPDGRPTVKEFCIERLGAPEAFRQALRVRAEYELYVTKGTL